MSRARLLQVALPLVQTHGFTRETLARSVLSLPDPHPAPLSESAVSALFGVGDDARRTLITAWLEDARVQMQISPTAGSSPSMREVLRHRLRLNEPVLSFLPEALALLISPNSGLLPVDPRPALVHAASVADAACYAVEKPTIGLSWYAQRASIASVYAAAELHQLTSPQTAYEFLDSLLDTKTRVQSAVEETALFANYIGRSWAGIIHSRGIF